MSSDKLRLGADLNDLTTSPRFEPYSKVTIKANNALYTAGDDTGRNLDIDCPFGTSAMATNILNSIKGYSYQPYDAINVYPDPSAEIGDAITVRGIYSGVYKVTIDFSPLMPWSISAGTDEELEHEFGYTAENGRYVTYAGLRNGTTAVNGAGLINNSVTTAKTSTGINNSLGYADYSNGVWGGWNSPTNCLATNLGNTGSSVSGRLVSAQSQFVYEGHDVTRTTITINGSKYYVLGWS